MTYLIAYWIVAGFTCWAMSAQGTLSDGWNMFLSFLVGGFWVPARLLWKVLR